MFQFLRGVVLVAAVAMNSGAAFGQINFRSANFLIPHCRNLAAGNVSGGDPYLTGVCLGLLVGISALGPGVGVCTPSGVTPQQAANVVIQYIEGQPERMHEDFVILAIERLRAVWPCRN